jgi:hypothetical protein
VTEADEIAESLLPGYQASLDAVKLGPTLDDARNWIKRQYESFGGWENMMSMVMLDNIAQSLERMARKGR